jgi:hypothetical protein
MSRTGVPVYVEGLAPRLCVRLDADAVPGLMAAACVGQRLELVVPEACFRVQLRGRLGDAPLECRFEVARTPSGPPVRHCCWTAELTTPTSADLLAEFVATEVAWARRGLEAARLAGEQPRLPRDAGLLARIRARTACANAN